MDKCCCGSKTESTCEVEQDTLCPVCKISGVEVESFTVKHLVVDMLTELVGNTNYYLCTNEDCNIVYYNKKTGVNFNKEQVNVPIWFKKDANPKYACYCSKVTEEQVIYAVVKDGTKSINDIIDITGAMRNAQGQKNNPLGTCCHKIIQDAIDKALSVK